MNAKLTIDFLSGVEFFFHTRCKLEKGDNRVEITFTETVPGAQVNTTIGFLGKRVTVFRAVRVREWMQDTVDFDQFFVLDESSERYARALLHLEKFELFLLAEGLQVEYTEDGVEAKIRCFMGYEDARSDEMTLRLICRAE